MYNFVRHSVSVQGESEVEVHVKIGKTNNNYR